MKRFGIMYLDLLNGLKCRELHEPSIAIAEAKACEYAVKRNWIWFRVHELP